MIFVMLLLFGFCFLLQLDERLSVQATHWGVFDELTREGGVLSLGENLFPSLIAKLTFNLLTSHHRRANFRQISRSSRPQTLFQRLKQRGIDSLLRVCRGCPNLMSIFHILTDKGVQKGLELGFFVKLSELTFFRNLFFPGQVADA